MVIRWSEGWSEVRAGQTDNVRPRLEQGIGPRIETRVRRYCFVYLRNVHGADARLEVIYHIRYDTRSTRLPAIDTGDYPEALSPGTKAICEVSLSCYCLRPGTRPIGRKHPRQKRTRHSKPAGFAVARGKFDDFWGGHNHPSEQSYYLPVDSHVLATEFSLQRSLLGSMPSITIIPHSQMKRARTDVTGSSLETEGSVNETASIHLRSLPLAIVHKSRAAYPPVPTVDPRSVTRRSFINAIVLHPRT
ncbi:hypothetical protein HD553DRAFT_70550 [Filobasidium floriforme]|uniref:uncharacterized protein n=1 Tax=Filobasidium floriforme TaxID=5210 RepID=UPI001E8D87F9|nr:uncharacterized protein HD553DRAFT_70550 [Filobasidium floriforme]KAH8082320.1 hypothetical protein HD553DRAFT_70550 [Filobasidium floriforme]